MSHPRYTILLVILAIINRSYQDISTNKIDGDEDINPFAEAAAAILKEQNAQNIGGLVSSFLQSDGAKQLGDMLTGDNNIGQVLQNVASMVGAGAGAGGDQNQGFDPTIISNVLDMVSNSGGKKPGEGVDFASLLSLASTFMDQTGIKNNPLDTLRTITQTISAFVGPEASAREKSHKDHAWFLPPVLERMHVLFDHFMHSDIGRILIDTIGAEKFIKVFRDENGRLSYQKFVDMLENHSFRRHWIRMVTSRVATILTFVADPVMYKKYLTTGQHFVNSILKTQGFPKATYFDPNRPTETITALINYVSKNRLGVSFSSKQYVKPVVEQVQELLRLAQKSGLLSGAGAGSRELSDKLADTINLGFIEPIARVNRAYRFAKKVPACDKYVMCLVNHETQDPHSLPGLQPILSKGTSLILSWFLSSQTSTPFLTLYGVITDDDENCKSLYKDQCHDFHLEEQKVTTEYVHSEL